MSLWVQLPTGIRKKARTKKNTTADIETRPKIFEWTTKHQDVLDALKEVLTTAPVLGYSNFSREFILETNASLNGLGTILTQGKDREIYVIAYASHSLCPQKRSMFNYCSAKLKLLALKWAETEKFWDCLLGLWFQVYTDNNPLVYVLESK